MTTPSANIGPHTTAAATPAGAARRTPPRSRASAAAADRTIPAPISRMIPATAGTASCPSAGPATHASPHSNTDASNAAARVRAPACTCAAVRLNDPEPAKPPASAAATLAAPCASNSRRGRKTSPWSRCSARAIATVCRPPTTAIASAPCASCFSTYHASQSMAGSAAPPACRRTLPTRSRSATAGPASNPSSQADTAPTTNAATSEWRGANHPVSTVAAATRAAYGFIACQFSSA